MLKSGASGLRPDAKILNSVNLYHPRIQAEASLLFALLNTSSKPLNFAQHTITITACCRMLSGHETLMLSSI